MLFIQNGSAVRSILFRQGCSLENESPVSVRLISPNRSQGWCKSRVGDNFSSVPGGFCTWTESREARSLTILCQSVALLARKKSRASDASMFGRQEPLLKLGRPYFSPLGELLFQGVVGKKERKRAVSRMRSVSSLPSGATLAMEKNLEVVTAYLQKQKNAPLNLGRLDNVKNKRDHVYSYVASGKGVNAYILDKAL